MRSRRIVSMGWARALGAVLGVMLVVVAGCGSDDAEVALELGADWQQGEDFEWRDLRHPVGDFDHDLNECRSRLGADPWFIDQPSLNRSILLVGCMSKHGWFWLEAQRDGPPISLRGSGVGWSRVRA